MSFRIDCKHCQRKLSIQSSEKQTNEFKKFYAYCKECICVSVFDLSWSHDVHAPKQTKHALIAEEIRNMSASERTDLLHQFGFNLSHAN